MVPLPGAPREEGAEGSALAQAWRRTLSSPLGEFRAPGTRRVRERPVEVSPLGPALVPSPCILVFFRKSLILHPVHGKPVLLEWFSMGVTSRRRESWVPTLPWTVAGHLHRGSN